MGSLIKTFPDGTVAVAPTFVYNAAYQLTTADYSTPGHIIDGWYYVADNVTDESIAPAWVEPTGVHDAYPLGAVVRHNDLRWRSVIVGNVWEPGVSGWADADDNMPAWIQPTGAHDAYAEGALVKHNGNLWASLLAANVWEPGVANWRMSFVVPPSGVPPIAPWVQPTGAQDAYPLGARVTHNGQTWESVVAANVWEPGVYGWVVV